MADQSEKKRTRKASAADRLKWLVAVTEKQQKWLSAEAAAAGLKGTQIIRALIDRAMAEPSSKFRASLKDAVLQSKLAKLEEKAAKIEAQKAALTRSFKLGD